MLRLMPDYRDVDAGLRIDTLEARLAERDAALAARDAELTELRAGLAGAIGRAPSARARQLTRLIAFAGVLGSGILGLAFAAARSEIAREHATMHDTVEMSLSHQTHLERQITDAQTKLDTCTQQALAAPTRLPDPLFGEAADRAAIEAALDAAARDAEKCGTPSGPRGVGRARMIFNSMNGRVESASLDFGALSGAGLDECLLAPFRAVHVDAFKAGPVTLTKELRIK